MLRSKGGWDDGEVIGNFCVIEDALVWLYPIFIQNLFRKGGVLRLAERRQRGLHGADVIFGQGAGVSSGISQDFVFFVERLGQTKRIFGRETKAAIGFALQARQIKQQRRKLRGRFAFFGGNARLAQTFILDGLSRRDIPDALSSKIRLAFFPGKILIEPAARILAGFRVEGRVNFPVRFGDKFFNLLFALNEDRKRWRLDAADGCQMEPAGFGIESGHGASAIDADEPIGFGTADSGVSQGKHRLIIAQRGETFADGRRGHRLEPEPFDRLPGFGMLDDVAKDQFSFAPGVASVNELIDILSLEKFCEHLQAALRFFDRPKSEMRRDDGQMSKGPFAPFDLKFLRHNQFQQMTNG